MTVLEEYFTEENLPQHPQVDVGDYPEDTRDAITALCRLWNFVPPSKKSRHFSKWIQDARELNQACGEYKTYDVLEPIYIQWNKDLHDERVRAIDIVGPQSVVNLARAQAAKMRTPDTTELERMRAFHANFNK